MMPKYQRRPERVGAVQFLPGQAHLGDIAVAVKRGKIGYTADGDLLVNTPHGVIRAKPGDWIVRDSMGGLTVWGPGTFDSTWALVP